VYTLDKSDLEKSNRYKPHKCGKEHKPKVCNPPIRHLGIGGDWGPAAFRAAEIAGFRKRQRAAGAISQGQCRC